jgi:Trk K+ transport system NAD-binding subunit
VDWLLFSSIMATAAVGLAGILATFFAPTRTQRAIEQREAREFRQAKRLISNELLLAEGLLNLIVQGYAKDAEDLPPAGRIEITEWELHRSDLATALR